MTAARDDIDQLMEVMRVAFAADFGEAWTRRQVEDALLIGNCHYWLIDSRGRSVSPGTQAAGFSLSRTAPDEEELLLLAVVPEHRGKGLGRRILEDLAMAARTRGATRLLLEMRRGNPAENLYRAFGFEPIGERPNYYRMANGIRIDAITFARQLK